MTEKEKKITLDLLEEVKTSGNVVDDLLDKEMQKIDQGYGKSNDGLSNKILSLFTQGGRRAQLSEDEVVSELMEKRMVSKEVVWNILHQMEDAGIIRCTSGNRYELANNTLASRVKRKVEAENSLLRNMRLVINDHISRDELLDKQYLDHIEPFITRLELDDQQCDLVERSKLAVKKDRRQRAAFFWLILIILALLTTFALIQTNRANKNSEAIQNAAEAVAAINEELEAKNDSLEAAQRKAAAAADDARKAKIEAENNLFEAITARQEADRLRILAQMANDSIQDKNEQLERQTAQIARQNKRLVDKTEEAEEQRKLAEEAKQLAEKERRQAELLALSLNSAVRSQSLEDPRVQGLIARQSYKLFVEYLENEPGDNDTEGNHPYIFSALYQAVKNLSPRMQWSVKAHTGSVNDIIMRPDGSAFYTASSDGTVVEWDIDRWNLLGAPEASEGTLIGLDENKVYSALSLSSDNRYLFVGGEMDYLQLFNFERDFPEERKFINDPTFTKNDEVYALAFKNADNKGEVAAISRGFYYTTPGNLLSKSIRIQDFLPGQAKINSRANTFVNVDGQTIGLTANTRYERDRVYLQIQTMTKGVGEMEEFNFVDEIVGRQYGEAVAIAAQQTGSNGIIAIGLENGHLMVIKSDLKGRPIIKYRKDGIQTFRYHEAPITDIAFSANGHYMAVSSLDGTISIWDLRYFLDPIYQPMLIDDHTDWVTSLAFAKDDRILLAGSQDGRVYFWNFHSPDYADYICDELQRRMAFPNYDSIDDDIWRRFFGQNIEIDDQICR